MIKSNFIADVVDLLLDGDADGTASRPQLALITDTVYGYTSGGMFVNFSHLENINSYKCAKDELVLKNVKITAAGHDFEAEATLYFRGGIIERMEVSCTQGSFPRRELRQYTLTQNWAGGKQLSKE